MILNDAECEPHDMYRTHMIEVPSQGMIEFALNFNKRI